MTKSAMEQMVEYLEKNKERHYGSLWSEVRAEARRLLAEEQAQKPTAPAGMIEDLEKFSEVWCNPFWKEEISKLISRYRPVHSSEMSTPREQDGKVDTTPASLVEEATNKFLGWELPKDFMPDGGIVFAPIQGSNPIGTNLFTAHQARQMFEYCLSGYRPAPSSDEGLWEELNDLYKKSLYHPGLCLNVMGAYDVKDLLDKYRHPSTAKSADRCAELCEELRHICDHWSVVNEYGTRVITVDQITELADEFSKDADGGGK